MLTFMIGSGLEQFNNKNAAKTNEVEVIRHSFR